MRYQEFEPPPALRRHVRCVWQLEIEASSDHIETVFPDGCCEIIGHRKTPMFVLVDDKGWNPQQRFVFAAQQRSALRLAARGDVDCLGVRLQPAASALLLDSSQPTSLAQLRDQVVDLGILDAWFAERFVTAATNVDLAAAVAQVWHLLEQRLLPIEIDQRIESAVHQLEACNGEGPVAPVVQQSGMSERSFQSTFKDTVGLSAKELARILRLQATIRSLDEQENPLAELALERGFSDQAHATREVRRVTGTTPVRLREALRRDRTGDSSVRMAAAFIRGRLG